jgi:MFS family permease
MTEARPRAVRTAGAVALLASCADNYLMLLLLWIAAPQGWSGVETALVVVALRVPILVLGMPVGRCVDRWGARPMILADVSTRGVLLIVLFLVALGADRVPLLPVLVLGGLCGVLSPATYAGVRWLVPRVVPADRLGRANAVIAISDQLPLLLGAALVGPTLALVGPVRSLAVPVVLLGLAAYLALRLPRTAPTPAFGDSAGPARDRYRLPSKVVALIALSTTYYFVYGPYETASPGYVRENLGSGAAAYGLLWTLFGLGAVATLFLGPVLARRRPGLVNALGALAWGLVMLPLLVVDAVPGAAVVFLVGGAIWGPYTTVETGAIQRWVDPARHGAVFGLQRALLATATPLGAACGALALRPGNADLLLALSAGACALAGAAALTHRGLRSAS